MLIFSDSGALESYMVLNTVNRITACWRQTTSQLQEAGRPELTEPTPTPRKGHRYFVGNFLDRVTDLECPEPIIISEVTWVAPIYGRK